MSLIMACGALAALWPCWPAWRANVMTLSHTSNGQVCLKGFLWVSKESALLRDTNGGEFVWFLLPGVRGSILEGL